MATGFSVMDALNKNSKAGVDESPRARFRTKDISIFKMYRNKLNFYDLADIEELAGDILMYGLKQNLEVVFEPNEQGEYRIVAGERRWLALKHLVEQGYKDFEIATCKLTTPQDEDEEQVEIIIANAYRTKSLKDVIEEEQRLKACLERMKTDGKKIKGYDLQSGRLRDVIASMLKMSKTKIAQIESVNNNLIPEFREELNNERLTFSAAYELSGMSPEMQQEALAKYKENGELSYTEIKDMKSPQKQEQDAIDRETKKKLREQAEEEKMNNLPSDTQENGQKVHHIKLGATFFEEVASGEKTFELRKNDRDYKKGDILEMMEFKDGKNTGRTVRVLVTYILEEFAGLEDGYCIMATSLMNENGEPFDRADLNQICADIRANGDGYIDGGEEYIMIENAVGIIAGGKED